jgi:hypothetical protein
LRQEISHDIPQLNDEEMDILTKSFLEEEVFKANSDIEHNKAPGPMTFQPSFIKKMAGY